jgi:hypothetical protein
MAKKKAVNWVNSVNSDWVDLEGLDIVGFWDKNDKLAGASLTVVTADNAAGTTPSDAVVDYGDATTALTIDLNAGSNNYILIPATRFSGLMRFARFISASTEGAFEQAAAYCKGDDGGSFANIATISGEAGYTSNYQLFPDAPADGDALYLGAAATFDRVIMDMSATVQVYDEAGVLAWQYYNGSAWASLNHIEDGTGSTATTGAYFGEQDGLMSFEKPSDWGLATIDSQSAYWIRAVIQADKADNMTTSGLTNSVEHKIADSAGEVAYVILRDFR